MGPNHGHGGSRMRGAQAARPGVGPICTPRAPPALPRTRNPLASFHHILTHVRGPRRVCTDINKHPSLAFQ